MEKASILIVDDNTSLCQTMSFILGRKGYAVTTAKDGLEALARGQGEALRHGLYGHQDAPHGRRGDL